MKNKIGPISMVAFWIIGCVLWGTVFSDFKFNLKNITINDWITLAFFLIFLVIIINAMLKLLQIRSITYDFNKATEQLNLMKENDETDFSNLKASFSNSALKDLYDKYVQETNRLQRDLPGGVGCDIEEFFNEENLAVCIHDDKLNQIPGTFTGIGMLGTFVGLTTGLSQFNFLGTSDGLAENINPLMSSIKVAFITSILGLLFSIYFNFLFRHSTEELNASIVSFVNAHHTVAKDDSHNQINKLLEVQVNQRDLLQKFSNTISDKITNGLAPVINDMKNSYEVACDRLKEAQELGMQTLINEFTKQLIGTLNITAKNLTKSISETRDYQIKTNEILANDISAIIELTERSAEINKLSANTVENIKKCTEKLDTYIKELVENITINTNNVKETVTEFETIFENNHRLFKESTDAFATIAEKNNRYVETLDSTLNRITGKYEDISNEIEKVITVLSDKSNHFEELYSKNVETLKNVENSIEKTLQISVGNILNKVSEKENPFYFDKINSSASEEMVSILDEKIREASKKTTVDVYHKESHDRNNVHNNANQ